MPYKKLLFLLLTGIHLNLNAQTFKHQYDSLVQVGDTSGTFLLLQKWEQEQPTDAELMAAWFNYYITKSSVNVLVTGPEPIGDNYIVLNNADSTGKPAGYMYEVTEYYMETLTIAMGYIDKGISLHPNRLDLRFGKIHMLGVVENYADFTTEIIKALDQSATNKNKWLWKEGEILPDAEKTFLGSVQAYSIQLYETNNDSLLPYMKAIAEATLKYYPKHVESLSNLSVVHLIWGEYDLSLKALKKAEKIDPNDVIVLSNIANTYEKKGDTKKALEYYKLVVKRGKDPNMIGFAEEQIKRLNEK